MGKNAHKLYYPMRYAIESILPIVDEFVIALGDSDQDDETRSEILKIGSDKIRIIDTVWDIEKFPNGMEHAHQTDLAKSACSGDWLFYLQSDEVIHEKFLPAIKARCEALKDDKEVEGLLFRYRHFYGDYKHIQDAHCWYRKEIRIIRNDPDIHSWQSAQSFRRIPDFDGESYRMQAGTYKLKVAEVDAEVYHYGWVRPPRIMTKKIKTLRLNHHGKRVVDQQAEEGQYDSEFDYGNLEKLEKFNGTHPKVMEDWILKFNWQNKLRYKGPLVTANTVGNKHDKPKYRFLSWIEKNLLFGTRLGEFNNFVRVRR